MASSILIVEDSPPVQEILRRCLSRDGYTVDVTDTVAGAKRLLAEHPYVALITDLHLREGSGLSLIKHCRRRLPTLPVILMSGEPPALVDELATRYQCAGALSKPFALAVLRQTLNALFPQMACSAA